MQLRQVPDALRRNSRALGTNYLLPLAKALTEATRRHLLAIIATGLTATIAGTVVTPFVAAVRPIDPMSGVFNIAVIDFGQITEGGNVRPWDDGARLSATLSQRIAQELAELQDIRSSVQVRHYSCPPESIISRLAGCRSLMIGRDQSERHRSAGDFAHEARANLVMYGNLHAVDRESTFIPEFYLRKILGAEELTGAGALGAPLSATELLPLATTMGENFTALAEFSIGLAFLNGKQPGASTAYFARAAERAPSGKEVYYLFLGTARFLEAQIMPKDASNEKLRLATQAYEAAARVNKEYSRAYIGLGNVNLLQFVTSGYQEQSKLNDASVFYQLARRAAIKPEFALVDAKARLGLAGVYSTMAQSGDTIRFAQAEQELDEIISQYEQGGPGLRDVAAYAYVGVGVIRERRDEKFLEAAQFYCTGAKLADADERLRAQAKAQLVIMNTHLSQPFECHIA